MLESKRIDVHKIDQWTIDDLKPPDLVDVTNLRQSNIADSVFVWASIVCFKHQSLGVQY